MEIFKNQQVAFAKNKMPSFAQRMEDLGKLYEAVKSHEAEIADAISADFGYRSAFESKMAEVSFVLIEIKHTRKHLRRWMKPERRKTALHFKMGSNRVEFQPKGVVGILSPWNYPFQLAMAPLVAALAAGNRVMIKPSEFSPKTGALMKALLAGIFDETRVAIVEGGADVAAQFSALPFNHMFFTGSSRVGKFVMAAAAENLTPVTLELGGKSPVIIGADYNIGKAAERIIVGKLLNAGQTCIAPDYVLVPENKRFALIKALIKKGQKLYPDIMQNEDYTSIASDAQYERLQHVLDAADEDGATIHKLYDEADVERKMMPIILDDVTPTMRVMQSEIFGPILPIIGYSDLDEAVEFVNGGDNPLAAYYFSHNRAEISQLSEQILCGNVSINETLYHIGQSDLPFGGVGQSGIGTYHGREGFKTFSHVKGVFTQGRLNGAGFLKPPYSSLAHKIIDWVS